MKECRKCKKTKTVEEFVSDKTSKDGLHTWCKECKSLYEKKQREADPEKFKKRCRDQYWSQPGKYKKACSVNSRKRLYGLSLEDHQMLLEKQNYQCVICKTPINSSSPVDHFHETKKVRGVLCQSCNKGLGCFKDKINFLEAALLYLKEYSHPTKAL